MLRQRLKIEKGARHALLQESGEKRGDGRRGKDGGIYLGQWKHFRAINRRESTIRN